MNGKNPLLSGSNERQVQQEPQDANNDPAVVDAIQQLSDQINELEDRNSELSARVTEIDEDSEATDTEIEKLSERVAQIEDDGEATATEIEELSERVAALEGDMQCPACSGQVRTDQVDEVYQEESESGLLSSEYEGAVTDLRCPQCGEMVDVTHLSDEERERLTNELRRSGVASGEVAETDDETEDGDD